MVWLFIYAVVVGVPCPKILKKAGFSPWWVLLILTGVGNIVVMAVLAFRPWKGMEEGN